MRNVLAAELAKQASQRGTFLWGFAAVPLFSTALALLLTVAMPASGPEGFDNAVHPLRSAIRTLSLGGNPVAQLFYAVGAAAFFAGDYRFATWRLIVPRASRGRLFGAKAAGFALCATASLALVLGGDLLATFAVPLVRHTAITDAPPATVPHLALAFATSVAELVALGGSAALLAVATRSTLATLLPVFLFSFVLAGAEAVLSLTPDKLAMLPLPTFAADTVRSWLAATADAPGASTSAAGMAAAALVAWSLLTYGAAAFLFSRQDLSKE